MSTTALWRLAGSAAFLGGGLFALTDVLSLAGSPPIDSDDVLRWGILAVASALGVAGLVGVYGLQAQASGILGLAGFVVSLAGLLLTFGFAWGGVVIVPEVLDTAFIQEGADRQLAAWILRLRLPVLSVGFLLLAVATLRARVLSRIGAWILAVGALLGAVSALGIANLLDPFGEGLAGGIGFAWLGWSVIGASGRGTVEAMPRQAPRQGEATG